MSRAVTRIARDELRALARDRVVGIALLLLTLLSVAAALTAWHARDEAAHARAHHQAEVDHAFDAQPDRHPHRMVHYGHFVFRPLNPLAAFDAGIDAYTGHTLYLEGHRQNSANFGDVRQSSLLMRFGQFTPAFVLQVLAPLLLVFVGHGSVARERASGTLRLLLSNGVRPAALVGGKVLALAAVAAVVLLPATLALAASVLVDGGEAWRAAALWAGHAAWLGLWVLVVATGSARCAAPRDALLVLLALWTLAVVLVPRLAAGHAAVVHALPTRFETDIAVKRELAAIGDSHNPDDPHFATFRRELLARYGVARIEDLPVNYKGVLGMEGERLTSALFDRHAEAGFTQQARQSRWMDGFALLSPLQAIRRLSLTAAGTDLGEQRRFLVEAEAHRYRLVQALNALQAEHLTFAQDTDPTRRPRVDRALWQGQAAFHVEPEAGATAARRLVAPALALGAWLVVAATALVATTRRLAAGGLQ
jgi:ABC-2 type transport system permease protein